MLSDNSLSCRSLPSRLPLSTLPTTLSRSPVGTSPAFRFFIPERNQPTCAFNSAVGFCSVLLYSLCILLHRLPTAWVEHCCEALTGSQLSGGVLCGTVPVLIGAWPGSSPLFLSCNSTPISAYSPDSPPRPWGAPAATTTVGEATLRFSGW